MQADLAPCPHLLETPWTKAALRIRELAQATFNYKG